MMKLKRSAVQLHNAAGYGKPKTGTRLDSLKGTGIVSFVKAVE